MLGRSATMMPSDRAVDTECRAPARSRPSREWLRRLTRPRDCGGPTGGGAGRLNRAARPLAVAEDPAGGRAGRPGGGARGFGGLAFAPFDCFVGDKCAPAPAGGAAGAGAAAEGASPLR